VPLVYKTNQELIDHQLKQANDIITEQTAQLRAVAQKHTESATQMTKQYMGDYTAKAQAMIRGTAPVKSELHDSDFPAPPKQEFKKEVTEEDVKYEEEEPLIAS
jgi:hypothetical protein